ncbi:MAG: MFS transporter [Bacteroidetes bacterium]|nr:MAG: MFS transporter [Bacteroidota bacterium]
MQNGEEARGKSAKLPCGLGKLPVADICSIMIKQYRQSFSGLSRESWLLSGVMFINRAGTMAIPFMSLYANQHLHIGLRQTGFLVTVYGIFSVLGASLGGWLTDKVGFRKVQIGASLGAGLAFFVFPLLQTYPQLLVLTGVLSVLGEAFRPANITAVSSYSHPQKLARSYSLNRLATNLGWAAGSSLGGLLAAVNYKLLFWVDGGTSILAGLLIWILLPKRPPQQVAEHKVKPAAIQKPWQDKLFVQFFVFSLAFITAFFLVFRLVPIFWKTNWQLPEGFIGLALGLNGIIIAFLEILLVTRLEKSSRSHLMFVQAGAVACALAFGLLLLPGWWPMAQALLFVVIITLSEMLALPFMNSFAMGRSNAHNRGQYAAGLTLTWSVSQIIGPAAGAALAEQAGYRWLWLALVACCLLSVLGFYQLRRQILAQQQAAEELPKGLTIP